MKEATIRLTELFKKLEKIDNWDTSALIDAKNKIILYISKFFDNHKEYTTIAKKIDDSPTDLESFNNSVASLKSLISTLVEDLELSNGQPNILYNDQKRQIDRMVSEINQEKLNIEQQSREINELQERLKVEREDLLNQQAKFNEFKSKLEIADKRIDFQFEASLNRKSAFVWSIISGVLIIFILIMLYISLESNNTFSEIATSIKNDLGVSNNPDSLTTTTIYFTYSKYLFTKVLIYSLLIYSIIFCIKNYNAQMHNHIINMHKSNAFKSTISLLDTAKSEDGNDKLLIQATQAIFSHQNTGYSQNETETPNPNFVTNVIESVSKKL